MNRTATRPMNLRQWLLALLVLVAGALFTLGATNAHAAPPAGTVARTYERLSGLLARSTI